MFIIFGPDCVDSRFVMNMTLCKDCAEVYRFGTFLKKQTDKK